MNIGPVFHGRFLRRYKRFFADILLDSGEEIVSHCANTGSMLGLLEPGARVVVSHHPHRAKLKYSWELVNIAGHWVGVNTSNPNRLMEEFINQKKLMNLFGLSHVVKREVFISDQSKCDLLVKNTHDQDVYVEVKNTTLWEDCVGLFPDSVTERGQKHLQELSRLEDFGKRTYLFFMVQHEGVELVKPADFIDSTYGRLLRSAVLDHGIGLGAIQFKVEFPDVKTLALTFRRTLPVDLSY